MKKLLPLLLLTTLSRNTLAACTNPTGSEQKMIYNSDFHVYQFCNGTKWVPMGQVVSASKYATFSNNTIGYTTVGSLTETNDNDELMSQPAVLDHPATIQSMSVYVSAGSGNLRLGIYDDIGGYPKDLKAETAAFASSIGWNTAAVQTPVALPAGMYWLVIATDNSGVTFKMDNGSTINWWYSYPFGPMASTYNSFSSMGGYHQYSAYATFGAITGCTNPTASEKKMIYNSASHTYQFCNGNTWISMGNSIGGGGGGCTSPAGTERKMIYNLDYQTYQFCNGTNWVKMIGASAIAPPTGTNGYFVMSKTQWNGNLGGVTGADAKCLTDLTTNTGWRGYADANSRGLLVAAKVQAFICTQGPTYCGNLNANTTYYVANANNASVGGARISADASGRGPNDTQQWSGSDYFGGAYSYWSNRNIVSESIWQTSFWSSTSQCGTYWDSSSSGLNGGTGSSTGTGSNRWYPNDTACNTPLNLICIVHP